MNKVIEAELVDELSPAEVHKPKKMKKGKRKKKNMTSLELPSEVAAGQSEAIRKKDSQHPDGDDMVLEDIKNENQIAYGHDHHTEVQPQGSSIVHQEVQQAQSSGEAD